MDFIIAKGNPITAKRQVSWINPRKVLVKVVKYRVYDKKRKKYVRKSKKIYKMAYRVKNLPKPRAVDMPLMHEYGYLVGHNSLDISIGLDNDFELKLSRDLSIDLGINYEDFIFADGTEFGGKFERFSVDTSSAEVVWEGTTWRGLLDQAIICPKPLEDYRIVSGDAHTILRTILPENGDAGTIFSVPNEPAGVNFTNYEFDRYVSKLDGLTDMLKSKGYKLKIWAQRGNPGGSFSVYCSAIPITDYTETINYSQDNRVNIRMTDDRGGVNHLICLGAGELKDRQRIDLYVSTTGKIIVGSGQGYVGISEKTAVYSYGSPEGDTPAKKLASLKRAGIKKLKELCNIKAMELDIEDTGADIGDIVGGEDKTTGLAVSTPITGKIYRDQDHAESIEIRTEREAEEDADY